MVDSPKTLADVKALLEDAVQIVNNLEASEAPTPDVPAPAEDNATEDGEQASENETPAAPADNPAPPTA